jgi:hypothetical protein
LKPPTGGILGECAREQYLHGDFALKMLVASLVDGAHAAGADLLVDSVVTEPPADHGRVSPPS